MKKIIIVLLVTLSVLFITGCNKDEKVLKCAVTDTGTNMNLYTEAEYHFKKDQLKIITINSTFKDIEVDNLSKVWDDFKKQLNEQNEPVEVDGYKRTTAANDKDYTFTVTLKIDYDKITKESMEKYGVKDYKDKSEEELKEILLQSENIVCE